MRSLAATATFFGVAVLTHVSLVSKAAVQVPAVQSSFASHFPTSFPQPGFKTLLALQAPAFVYRTVPELLGVTNSTAAPERKKASQLLAAKIMALAVGVHFSFALGVSGMMRPSKVLGFLALSPSLVSSGTWDPSLAMVAIGGIIPASIAYFRHVKPKQDKLRQLAGQTDSKKDDKSDAALRPELALVSPEWRTPVNPFKIDARLIIGSVLFGLGWGATGLVSCRIFLGKQHGLWPGFTDSCSFFAHLDVTFTSAPDQRSHLFQLWLQKPSPEGVFPALVSC